MSERTEVSLIGGPFDKAKVALTSTPYEIACGNHIYVMIQDPDSGDFLGGYVYDREDA